MITINHLNVSSTRLLYVRMLLENAQKYTKEQKPTITNIHGVPHSYSIVFIKTSSQFLPYIPFHKATNEYDSLLAIIKL